MAKKQPKYRPLKVVEDVLPVVDLLEKWHRNNPRATKKAQLDKAIGYAADSVIKKNRLIPGQRVPAHIKSKVEYETYDCATSSMVVVDWKNNKQVYRFSRDFYDMLLDVGNFQIGWSLFKYLPYSSFYLEVDGHDKIDGIMIRYMQCEGESDSLFYAICCKSDEFPETIGGVADPTENDDYEKYFKNEIFKAGISETAAQVVLMKEVLAFVFQACMYLCAKNAEIEENPEQQRIYRPSTIVRNKFSEIRKWDVGVRVTRDIQKINGGKPYKPAENSGTRRRPRQHWRKAHWHTYWIGPKGNQQKAMKFIAPILVNDNNDDTPVVIHQ